MDVFCKIVAGEIPSRTVYEDEQVKVFMDINPRSKGEVLVITKEHYENLFDIEDKVLNHVMVICRRMGELLEKKLGCTSITLEQNNGSIQEVKHFHVHVIPSYEKEEPLEDIEQVFHKIVD